MPKKSLTYNLPPIWSFPLCLLPVIISTHVLAPPHPVPGVWLENSNTPNSSLLFGQEDISASAHTGQVRMEKATHGAGEHGNAQGVGIPGGAVHTPVHMWASMHRMWVPHTGGRCAHRQLCGGGGTRGGGGQVIHQGMAPNLGPGARSEPNIPVLTVMLNHFMLVMSFTCWSEQAHHEQKVQPT